MEEGGVDKFSALPKERRKGLVNRSAIRGLVCGQNKQCSAAFLDVLERHVRSRVLAACKVHNGGAKRLGAGVAGFVGIRG